MKFTQRPRPRWQAPIVQCLVGIAGLTLITAFCLRIGFGLERAALAYIILAALVAVLGSFGVSVILSVVAATCLSYFFALPSFDVRVDAPDDIVRIATFLTTALIVTALVGKLRASERHFRSFVDHASDSFFLLDGQLRVLDVNKQACASLVMEVGCGQMPIGPRARYFSSLCRQARRIHDSSSDGFPDARADRRQRSRWWSSTGLLR